MRRKTKQALFLICLAIFLAGVMVFLMFCDKKDPESSDYQESDRQETIVYGGKEYRYNAHLSNYVFIGVDKKEPITGEGIRQQSGRADSIFFLSYDRVKKTVKCIAIPRDTMTNIRLLALDGTDMGTAVEHINMQYLYGDGKHESCRLVKEAVSNLLYGVPIQGYYSLNMDGIAVAVDVLGGVELVLTDNSLASVNPEFVEGAKISVTKDNAEQIVRYRDVNEAQSALQRINRQKQFMRAISERAKEKSAKDNDFVVGMYESLEPYTVTNIENHVMVDLLEAKFNSDTDVIDLPGEGVEGELYDEYHIDEIGVYELVLKLFYEEV